MSYSYIGGESRESFSHFEENFKLTESMMGYLPNSHLIMANNPDLLEAFEKMAITIFMSKHIDRSLIQLIALASSLSSGCKYCQAHTSHGAGRSGVDPDKIVDILKYNESDRFSDAEKAALGLAFSAGSAPNTSEKKHFIELEKYFSKEAIVDIVSVIALFGFLNRWNDTFGMELESEPKDFVEKELYPLGWE